MAIAPTTPKHRVGSTLAEFLPLRDAEQKALEACRTGNAAIFNDGELPKKKPAQQQRIRADFLRFLCIGGDADTPMHERGISVIGAWIEPDPEECALDLDSCVLPRRAGLFDCWFAGTIVLMDASGGSINLDGSCVADMTADRIALTGDLFLRNGFRATGEVSLVSATIDGNLDCSGGSFEDEDGSALSCDNATITGALFFRNIKSLKGNVRLASTKVGTLMDDAASWHKGGPYILDGFTYDTIGSGPTDAATRIAWLKTQRPEDLTGPNFRPQPWTHLIKVLRRMGHKAEADEVSIAFQDQRRAAGRVQTRFGRLLHRGWGLLAGYGHKPLQLLTIMAVVWFICGGLYWAAAVKGGFGPSNPLVFNAEQYDHCRPTRADPPHKDREGKIKPTVGNWFWCPELAGEYTTFQPSMYSLDILLPLVDLQQEKDWSPIIPTPRAAKPNLGLPTTYWMHLRDVFNVKITQPLPPDGGHVPWFSWTAGEFARALMWFQILFGWMASLLLVAVLTGLAQKSNQED